MKTLLTILMVALFGAMVSAGPSNKVDYLVTKDGKFIVADVHFGILNFNAKTTEGNKLKINYNDVIAFQKDGDTYVKKPIYNDGKPDGMAFMRLVSWKNGFGLYCYEELLESASSNKRYFIFKDENIFWLEVSLRNAETIRIFFSK